MKALDGIPYVAKHLKDEDEGGKVLYVYVSCMHGPIKNIVINLFCRKLDQSAPDFPNQSYCLFSKIWESDDIYVLIVGLTYLAYLFYEKYWFFCLLVWICKWKWISFLTSFSSVQ